MPFAKLTLRTDSRLPVSNPQEVENLLMLTGLEMEKGKAELAKTNFSGSFFKLPFAENYSPDTLPSDYIPKEEDFVRVPFRLISAAIVAPFSWRATDFSKKGILEASIPLLVGRPAHTDHSWSVNKAVGVVESAWYSGTKKDASGNVIPAGINGVYKVDAKAFPELARGLMSNPPSIQGSSVTIEYEWEPSHKFENKDGETDWWKFFDNIGTLGQ